jgi:hypothetical protein
MRPYIVIPEGTPILHVTASTPHHAASKARHGKATLVATEAIVLPVSRTLAASNGRSEPIPGQLTIEQARG